MDTTLIVTVVVLSTEVGKLLKFSAWTDVWVSKEQEKCFVEICRSISTTQDVMLYILGFLLVLCAACHQSLEAFFTNYATAY